MTYYYSRRTPIDVDDAIEILAQELSRYRGGKILSSEDASKEHPLHFAVRQVESYRPFKCQCSRNKQVGSLPVPANIMWYSLLDHSRSGDRAKAKRCRKRLLEMLEYIRIRITNPGQYHPHPTIAKDKEILSRGFGAQLILRQLKGT